MLAGKAEVEKLFAVRQVINRWSRSGEGWCDVTMKVEVRLPPADHDYGGGGGGGGTHIAEVQLQHLAYVAAKREAHAHVKSTRRMIGRLGLFPSARGRRRRRRRTAAGDG